MIPQISGAISEQIEIVPYPSLTYKLTDDEIVGDIDGIESVQQAVYHIVMTERYSNVIYDNDYGIELEQYKGRGFNFLQATIQDTLSDALLQDDRITSIVVDSVTQTAKDAALIRFTVFSSKGTFGMEVDANF